MHRRTRCGWAQHKQNPSNKDHTTVDKADPQNANVYVGNVAPDVSESDLRQHFGPFGHITDVKIYRKGKYTTHCHRLASGTAILLASTMQQSHEWSFNAVICYVKRSRKQIILIVGVYKVAVGASFSAAAPSVMGLCVCVCVAAGGSACPRVCVCLCVWLCVRVSLYLWLWLVKLCDTCLPSVSCTCLNSDVVVWCGVFR